MRLAEVTYFEFGERYVMRSAQGERPYQDLEDLLRVMGEMFQRERHVYMPLVKNYKRVNPASSNGLAITAVLRVTATTSGLPAPDDWIASIRKRVTHYNLSGNWDYFETENL